MFSFVKMKEKYKSVHIHHNFMIEKIYKELRERLQYQQKNKCSSGINRNSDFLSENHDCTLDLFCNHLR